VITPPTFSQVFTLPAAVSISSLTVSALVQINTISQSLMVTSTATIVGSVTSTIGALTFQKQDAGLGLTIAAGSVSSTSGLISASSTIIAAGGVLANNSGNIYISGDMVNSGNINPAGAGSFQIDGNLINVLGAGVFLTPGPLLLVEVVIRHFKCVILLPLPSIKQLARSR